LRKILVAATAALLVMGGATAALAQTAGAPTLKVSVSPTKAGTKKKPKNTQIHLKVVNNDPKKSLSSVAIGIPKTLKLSGKGFKACSESFLNANGPAACPKGSKIGGGTSDALVGVNGPSQTPLHFVVTAFVGGKNTINFYLHSTGIPINVVAPGKVHGSKLVVTVPVQAQQPAPGVWAGLVSLETTLKGKVHKHFLVASTGCKSGKDKFTAALTFANNGVSTPGTVTVGGAAKCKK
jgi:hypothetical protein